MSKNTTNIEELKEIRDAIQKINPSFTDDLLYLLYEYVCHVIEIIHADSLEKIKKQMKVNDEFQKMVQGIALRNVQNNIMNGTYDRID